MAHVVFLRAANVGGHGVFRPKELAARLPELGLTSIGAAGTFVVAEKATAASVRRAIAGALPFETDIIVRPAKEVISLVAEDPLAVAPDAPDAKSYVTVLAGKPGNVPKTPVDLPTDGPWEVRIVDVRHPYVLTLRRPVKKGRWYPNEAVERTLGVPGTTRGWATMERVARRLADGR